MDQPLSFYIAPKNAPALPVAPVPQKQLDEWSAETEIASGAGAMRKGGKWRVYIGEARNQDDALGIYDRVRTAGYAGEIRPVQSDAGLVYRVRISNMANKQEAEVLAGKLKGKLGIDGPRVSR